MAKTQYFVLLQLVLLSMTACGGGGNAATEPEEDLKVVDVADRNADLLSLPDLTEDAGGSTDTGFVLDLPTEVPHADFGPACEPGDGCSGDPCKDKSDCLSGWCIEHMGDGICTQSCAEECPAGWSCQDVGTGPDVVSICVSAFANLCKPCSAAADCKSTGADDVCLDYGASGSFCGGACADDVECPWGFTCLEAQTVDGLPTTQCVADAGECPCTARSVELALWTPCASSNEFGQCAGMRVCTEEGLGDCDAGSPQAELCNGLDDDCDGEIDEPDLLEGKYVELCDDGNECTADACFGADGCDAQPLDEGECGDGDACTVGDHCEEGTCVGLPIVCDDNNPCTDESCDGLGGCLSVDNLDACDDGDPCTVADQCAEGLCSGFALECDCTSDEDCDQFEDEDLCNGTLYCDQSQQPFRCEVEAGTVKECPVVDDQCMASACLPGTGECVTAPSNNGFACDDEDACTIGDICQDGGCLSGVAPNCNDGNGCTNDLCDPLQGCTYDDNEEPCNDGNACTGSDQCQGGSCEGGLPLQCDDNNPCTDDWCAPQAGCVHNANQESCDDGNLCTENDVCLNGQCTGGPMTDCTDNNPCTADGCLPEAGCSYTATTTPCTDNDPCTMNDQCLNGVCVSGAQVSCDDGNPCTADSCGDAGICLYVPQEGACDDENACTLVDHCELGKCIYGQIDACDDGEICTTDSCDPLEGCVHSLNEAPCDDADVCTFGDHCHLGECISSSEMICDDGNLCTDDNCNPQIGCQFVANDEACGDDNECTVGDACAKGECMPGPPAQCDDQLFCNGQETCDPAEGCMDGTPPVLDDDIECTVDLCDEESDKVFHAPNHEDCADDEYCNGEEICDLVQGCIDGPDPELDDLVPCTIDFCDEETEEVLHQVDHTECDDGQACTEDVCDPLLDCQNIEIADCGGPHYVLTGEPSPSTVFNTIADTHYYDNNLVNGVWHGPANKIIVGHSYNTGYWSYDASSTNYGQTPTIQVGSYDRMALVPKTGLLFSTTNGHDAPLYNQIYVATIDHETAEVGAFSQVQFSDGFTGKCNLMSNTPDQFLCWDGAVIRQYDTEEDSNVVTHAGNLTLSPTPNDVCSGGCYQGTFAWDGKYYYFTWAGSGSSNRDYQVYNADGTYQGKHTATGGGAISGAYFDWSSGRYSTHDGWGNRTGGNIHSPVPGFMSDDSQSYSPISTAHTLP